MLPEKLLSQIGDAKIIAVLVIDEAEHAVPLAQALLRGGITAIELTMRTPAALPALRKIREEAPDLIAGVGTILTTEQAEQAHEAGAAFGVAPGLNPSVVKHAAKIGLPFAPGVMTPSEIELAIELDCKTLKYFPAEPNGGLKTIKAMAAPYAHLGLGFVPLGGLSEANMASYLGSPLIPAIGGSWIATRDAIKNEDWDGIEQTAKRAMAIANG